MLLLTLSTRTKPPIYEFIQRTDNCWNSIDTSHGNDGRSDSRAEVVGKEAEDGLDQKMVGQRKSIAGHSRRERYDP